MGLFDFLFSKPAANEKDNDFFGKLRFIRVKGQADDVFYNGSKLFRPTGKKVDITIRAGAEGPTEAQVIFFKEIEEKYETISKSIIPLIEDLFRTREEDFAIKHFEKEYELLSINIHANNEKPVIWEIAFVPEYARNHFFIIIMHDFEAKEILIDG